MVLTVVAFLMALAVALNSGSGAHVLPLKPARQRSWNANRSDQWLATRETISTELEGNILRAGIFYADVKVGTELFTVQIDTGSSVLAIPVDRCTTCDEGGRKYTTEGRDTLVKCSDSSSCIGLEGSCFSQCDSCSTSGACCVVGGAEDYCYFDVSYADSSFARGSLIEDTFEFGSSGLTASVAFGGIFQETANFEPHADGILGLSPRNEICNPNCVETVMASLVTQNEGLDDVFALCVTPKNGGVLAIGGVPDEILAEPLTWIPYPATPFYDFYDVSLSPTMFVGDIAVQMHNVTRARVDSGEPDLLLPAFVLAQVEPLIEENVCNAGGLCTSGWFRAGKCYEESAPPFVYFPSLTFELVGDDDQVLQIVLEPEVYLLNYSSEVLCVGFREGDGDLITFGDTVLAKYATVYDRAQKRMGFATAAADCGRGTPVVDTCTCSMDPGLCLFELDDGACEETECSKMYCDLSGDFSCEVQQKDVLKRCSNDASQEEGATLCCTRESGTVVVQKS